jgi:D-alanyl-D-alanine carboxypeptidase
MKSQVLVTFSRYIAESTIGVLFCVGAIACASSTPSTASNQALLIDLHQDLANYLSARSAIEHISTLSMTISFREGQTINMAVGTTTFGGGALVTPSNLFQIGSNTKAYTAALILRLEAAGVLSINDTLGKWLPQYPAWSNVTIKQLLNMTSGIPSYDLTAAQIADYGSNPYVEDTLPQLVAYVYPTTSSTPWLYSNTGYILLEMIINEASSSHDYQTELAGLITAAGLTNTFYQPYFYPSSVTQRLVAGYYVNTDPPDIPQLLNADTSAYSLGWAQAAGGMVSTPQDLTVWVRALLEGNILAQKQRAELLSLVSVKTGQPIAQTTPSDPGGFGLGIFSVDEPTLGGTFWGYQGSTIGYRAAYGYFPTTGLIICIFTNSQTTSKNNELLSVLFPAIYDTLKANGRT